jgi:AcrR family transcriptional regulator
VKSSALATPAGAAVPGTYAKGRTRAADILDAGVSVLIEHGYHNFSLRRVADEAGLRLGNLQHYFPSKDALVQAMLDRVIEAYLARFVRIQESGLDPEAEFRQIIDMVFRDLNTRRTTVFFPELWSLANHDTVVAGHMDRMYARYRDVLGASIARINPALDEAQVRRLALFVSASIEGHTVFVGHGKPWRKQTQDVVALATASFLWLIRSGSTSSPAATASPAREPKRLREVGHLN